MIRRYKPKVIDDNIKVDIRKKKKLHTEVNNVLIYEYKGLLYSHLTMINRIDNSKFHEHSCPLFHLQL